MTRRCHTIVRQLLELSPSFRSSKVFDYTGCSPLQRGLFLSSQAELAAETDGDDGPDIGDLHEDLPRF
jgi:hypothetical protein